MPTGPRPVCIGRNRRFAPGNVSAPRPAGWLFSQRPFGRGEIGLIQRVFGRIGRLHGDRPVPGQQQDDVDLEHRGDLERRRPQQVVQHGRAGELAGKEIEVLGGVCPLSGGKRLGANPGRQVADDYRDHGKEKQRDDVLGIRNRECVKRRQKEEIVGEDADQTGE